MNVCIYHADCVDGFTAAWVLWKKWGGVGVFVPCRYGDPLPSVVQSLNQEDTVIIVDFSFPRVELDKIASQVKFANLLVLDHHKTAEAELHGYDFAMFDMDRCGSMMAWQHFFPHEPIPLFLEYVQDHDLWKREMPNTRAVAAWIRSHPFDFPTWATAVRFLDRHPDEVVQMGTAILQYQERAIEAALKSASLRRVGQLDDEHSYTFYGANVSDKNIVSEVGHRLAQHHTGPNAGVGMTYRDLYNGQQWVREYSLRSLPDGPDVSEIAKQFGGGGHKHAAGFTLPI